MHRVFRVAEAMRADPDEVRGGGDVLNLRGRVSRVDDLVANMAASFPRGTYDLVVIDPAYKVQSGSENDADALVDMIELQPDEAAMEAERILGHRMTYSFFRKC